MKSLILALALLAGLNVQASTVDSFSLPVTGAKTEENLTLRTVQTRTEYRNETVQRTCYRTVLAGYRQECRQEPVVICYDSGPAGRVCTTNFQTRCYSVPDYRQEAYTCYQTVSVPYEVYVADVLSLINVNVKNVPGDILAPNNTCLMNFTQKGADLSMGANCAEFIVLANKTSETSEVAANKVTQRKAFEVTLLDSNKVSAPTKKGITQMKLNGQTLSFVTGDLTKNADFTLKLFVERRKLLKDDETLINRNLAPSEYTFEKTSEDSGIVKINLTKLVGGINSKRKHVLKVDLKVNTDLKGVINTTLPQLSASESMTVNN